MAGFSLIETVIAVFVAGTAVVAVVAAVAAGVRVAARQEESVKLTSVVRAQIEVIKQAPFASNVGEYPQITPLPEGVSITVSATDPGIAYAYANGTPLTGTVQHIRVTARGDFSELSLTFYRVDTP